MIRISIILGLGMALVSFNLAAAELEVPLQQGKPSQQEFERAAERALFSRNYEIGSIGPDVVIGKYKDRVEVALILADDRVVLRILDDGGVQSEVVTKYLRNLERDFTYEIADYALQPTAQDDPARLQALVQSVRQPDIVEPVRTYVIAGQYQSRVTAKSQYAFKRASHRNLVITFEQDGNNITGFNESANLEIQGVIEGDEIRFVTSHSDVSTYELKGKWEITEGGKRLTGRWTYSHGDGDWNLTKM